MIKGADLVQENRPERIDFKQKLFRRLDDMLSPDVIIASSSSGLTMSEIQSGCKSHPERFAGVLGLSLHAVFRESSPIPDNVV